jgi:hypothetical protein
MSHFAVAVITKGKPTEDVLAAMLAPYDENKEVLHFTSREELIKQKRQEISNFIESNYARYLTDKEKYLSECTNQNHVKYITEEFPKMLLWTDEECYQDAIKNTEKENICKDGSVRSTYNPDSKWDWYQIGGRWAGLLTVKKGTPHENGEKSWTWDEKNPYESTGDIIKCDSARIKDLVFLDKEKDAQRARRFWELHVEGAEPQNDEERDMLKWAWYKKEYYIETYKDKETYVRCESAFSTYAAITKDGKWHAKGKMGWFGMSSDEDVIAWHDGYQKLIFDDAEEDDYITIVDCHI